VPLLLRCSNETVVKRVTFVDLVRLHAPLRKGLDDAWRRVMDSGRFVMGPEVDGFESELGAFCGAPHVVATSSGTDALLLALMALGVGPGHEVVTPAYSFIAAAEAVARLGATPIFADIGEDFDLDPLSALAHVGNRTRAIVVVDLFGRRAEVGRLAEAGIPIVEDAAQAIGAPGVGGTDVCAAATSFFPTKNLGALGDGGALITRDEGLALAARTMRSHGAFTVSKYVHQRVGGNMRLDALQAAMLRVKLPHVSSWNTRRAQVAARYRSELAGTRGLVLPSDAPGHVWHQFVVRVPGKRRDAMRAHLAEHGVSTEVYYPLPLHLQPCFAHLGGAPGDHPVSEAAAEQALALPIHPALEDADVDYVIDAIRRFLGAVALSPSV
jgi:dTDP-4-amino-4,6-dideoxygalactose transaminase